MKNVKEYKEIIVKQKHIEKFENLCFKIQSFDASIRFRLFIYMFDFGY